MPRTPKTPPTPSVTTDASIPVVIQRALRRLEVQVGSLHTKDAEQQTQIDTKQGGTPGDLYSLAGYMRSALQATGSHPLSILNLPGVPIAVKGGNGGGGGGSGKPITVGGDLSGDTSNAIVTGIQGRVVANVAPTNGQALVWSAANNEWMPETVASGYVLPPASATILGGVKIGSGISVAGDGTISITPGAGGYWQPGSPANAIYYSGGPVAIGTSNVSAPGAAMDGLLINIPGSATAMVAQVAGSNAFALNANSDGSWQLFDYAAGNWANSIYSRRGNIGILGNPQVPLDVNGVIRTNSAPAWPTSGQGLELACNGGIGDVHAYDRSAGGYLQLKVDGNPLSLNTNSGANTNVGGNLVMPNNANTGNWRILMPDVNHCIYSSGLSGNNMYFIEYGNWHFYDASNSRDAVTITNLNVGISQPSPVARLEVSGSGSNTPAFNNQLVIREGSNNPAYGLAIGFIPPYDWCGSLQAFNNNNPGWLVLNALGGNVGIGTSYQPQAQLDVCVGSKNGLGYWGWPFAGSVINYSNAANQSGLVVANTWASTNAYAFVVGCVNPNVFGQGSNFQSFFTIDGLGTIWMDPQSNQPVISKCINGANGDGPCTVNGQWYTWLQGPPWQFFFRVRCFDGTFHQSYMNLA